jgi:hypothetical protein
LPGGGNGQCFHKDILMSLLRLSSAPQREQARATRSGPNEIHCAFGLHAHSLSSLVSWEMKEDRGSGLSTN